MTRPNKWQIVGFAFVTLVGWAVLWLISPLLFGVGLAVAMVAGGIIGWKHVSQRQQERARPVNVSTLFARQSIETHDEPLEPGDLIGQMLRQGRYALLLRPQIVPTLPEEQVQRALGEIDERMALVPDGDVVLKATRTDTDERREATQDERLVHVEAMFLDRYPVTNKQYKAFIDGGGYEQISLWDPTVWPAILDFVDSTGHSGPRLWKEGSYPPGEADHPVVGVSWYEASAYARWVGKRLPTDPEWVKAGGWPVQVPGGKPLQRKHPWGDTMDRGQANLWGGPGATTPVYEFHNGGTVGGIYQLIGNVWEWTTSNYGAWDAALRRLESPNQMKSIRGGAFDTYFDNQANCQFQSGDSPMSRKHNIGFRCALSVCDLAAVGQRAAVQPAAELDEEFHEQTSGVAEVAV